MKKIYLLALAATVLASCTGSVLDEELESMSVMVNAPKTAKEKNVSKAKGTKTERDGIMLIKAQSVAGPWKPFPIRHPTEE